MTGRIEYLIANVDHAFTVEFLMDCGVPYGPVFDREHTCGALTAKWSLWVTKITP
jgi:hypothetical protein